jgi:NAD(P)-dependent dehydrogenase (short-subunit alcohol dehydrogenase family)
MDFTGHVVLITGAGRGIGKAVALSFARRGAAVIITGRSPDTIGDVERIIREGEFSGSGEAMVMDVTRKEQVCAVVNEVQRRYGKVDVLVNNAGTDIKGEICRIEESVWDHIVNLNLKGTFLCTQAVMAGMMERRYGRIINMSSMAGRTGEPYTSPYNATKFGIIGFTQSVALEAGPYNVTVNAVCPGPVETELIHQSVEQSAAIKGMTSQEFLDEFFISKTPMGRIASPQNVADAVMFFASEYASFVTGTALNVSGGREMH